MNVPHKRELYPPSPEFPPYKMCLNTLFHGVPFFYIGVVETVPYNDERHWGEWIEERASEAEAKGKS